MVTFASLYPPLASPSHAQAFDSKGVCIILSILRTSAHVRVHEQMRHACGSVFTRVHGNVLQMRKMDKFLMASSTCGITHPQPVLQMRKTHRLDAFSRGAA